MDFRELFRRFRHLSETPGIGGRIKVYPEDFIVREVLPKAAFRGPCLLFLLKKRNWETMAAIKEIAKRLGIHYSEIGFAGTKDRHAVTYQYISICRPELKERVNSIKMKGVELRFVGKGRRLKLGMLLGNRFLIRVRGPERPENLPEIIGELKEKGGFPNYFGPQRFGERRVVNHLVGKLLLLGDFESAARLFLGYAEGDMEGDEARRNFWETGDVERALEEFPKFLRYERAMLYRYRETGSWKKAFLVLPRPIARIFIHAYQAYLFNLYLSRRIEEGMSLAEAIPGDIVVQVKGGIPLRSRTYRVTETNVDFVNEKIKAGEAMVTGPIFGLLMRRARGLPGRLETEILEGEGISLEAFKRLPKPLREPGGRRELLIKPLHFAYKIEERSVLFRFFLPKGVYATSVLREIMKDH
ncbi:tRNA pseudouridine(13) synthase TruD [Pyrococcus yayanosii]|uniref:Probable tRNA pseudouridine synthase D n=1 Tax=Pyrococcus yayanosii (strain CH1 / JCM 16557) TaxID=529709 RepID=F8AH28_PYRYC|nr:tRNA pseudouridine(13) synthase TruD [Pyrococcus yayanosii]AEH24088.1 tRNA pseudouridine synthase D [Pyrococcus yayanosii CH1]